MQFKKRERNKLNLDMTPLIDVIFLLLIFFMISTTFISYNEIKIKLPEAATESREAVREPMEITITEENELFLGEQKIEIKNLLNQLKLNVEKSKQRSLLIRADGQVKHKVVVQVMDVAKLAGIDKLSIATILKQK